MALVIGTPHSDVLTGTDGADVVFGFSGADFVAARGGDDIILAGPGRDTLDGGVGVDTLIGGPGADVFRFGWVREPSATSFILDSGVGAGNRDVVLDFRQGQDKLDLSGYEHSRPPGRAERAGLPGHRPVRSQLHASGPLRPRGRLYLGAGDHHPGQPTVRRGAEGAGGAERRDQAVRRVPVGAGRPHPVGVRRPWGGRRTAGGPTDALCPPRGGARFAAIVDWIKC